MARSTQGDDKMDDFPPDAGAHNQKMPAGGLRFVCPACQSTKPEPVLAFCNRGPDYRTHTQEMMTIKCSVCDSDPKGATREDIDRWNYGREIRKQRIDREVSIYEEAKRLGISSSALSALEHGQRPGCSPFTTRSRQE